MWSSVNELLQRYTEMKPFINITDYNLVEFLPTALEELKINELLKIMNKLNSVTLKLQEDNISLLEVRNLFD